MAYDKMKDKWIVQDDSIYAQTELVVLNPITGKPAKYLVKAIDWTEEKPVFEEKIRMMRTPIAFNVKHSAHHIVNLHNASL